jgi:hypothetical protein
MKPTKYLIDNEDIDIFFHNGRYWFFRSQAGGFLIVPAVGDLVVYENGKRTMVVLSEVKQDADGLSIDVEILRDRSSHVVTNRGRLRKVIELADDNLVWPIENISIIRDSIQIYPVTLKYRLINKCVINKFFIKKYIHLKYAELKMNYKRIINKCSLFKDKLIKKFYEYKKIVAQKFKIK